MTEVTETPPTQAAPRSRTALSERAAHADRAAADLTSLRAKRRRFSMPRISLARLAWRLNAASLGAGAVIATVAWVRSESWGALATSLSVFAFLSTTLVYRIARLRQREPQP